MSLLMKLPEILEESKNEYEELKAEWERKFQTAQEDPKNTADTEGLGQPECIFGAGGNILAQMDNVEFMCRAGAEFEGKIQLIYIDPPFFSKAKYEAVIKAGDSSVRPHAYTDLWKQGMEEYLKMFCVRAFFMKDMLTETGCIWIHLDWHGVHYIKVLMDEIFGEKNFINEVIWTYKSGGTSKKTFAKKHDTLLFYGKSNKYYFKPKKEKSYNRGLRPYRFKGVKEYRDEKGWFTLVNMKDVWSVDMVGRTSKERTGYATQKPVALVSRIIESCSKPGDICADFFSGSGVLGAAAAQAGRRFISCDGGELAVGTQMLRFSRENIGFEFFCSKKLAHPSGKLKVCMQNTDFTEKSLVKVALQDYSLDIEKLPLSEKDKEVTVQCEPMKLIAGWSVDFHYDGSVHRSEFAALREDGDLLTFIEGRDSGDMISVMVIDIFGIRTTETFDLRKDSHG